MLGFKKNEKKEWDKTKYAIGAPVKGRAVPLSEVSDVTFSERMLGDGMAVIPEEGKIFAPSDGQVTMVFDTLHAVSIKTDFGAEILIHVGLDTVNMKGEGFTEHIKAGAQVKKGDLLLEMDLDKIREGGYDPITPMVVCNTPDYVKVESITGSHVKPGDDVVVIHVQ